MEPSIRQRSRKGCLTCRQKRKKCDEIKPVCGRCKGRDDCIWPASQSTLRVTLCPSRLPRIQPRPLLEPKTVDEFVPLAKIVPSTPTLGPNRPISNGYHDRANARSPYTSPSVPVESDPCVFTPNPLVNYTPPPNTSNPLPELGTSLPASVLSIFDSQQYPLGVGCWPFLPVSNTLALICMDGCESAHALDEDEEEAFKTAEWLPGASRLLGSYLSLELPGQGQVQWSSIVDSYFTFLARNSYDPSNLPTYICDFVAYNRPIESMRLGVLGTSIMFYSFLNPGLPQVPLQKHAKEFIDAAAAALWFEESQTSTTLNELLAGISEIIGFYYFTGDLGSYLHYVDKAFPLIQKLVGAAPVSIHKLYGTETLDIRLYALCDVFSAMATSRPTRLVYDCNVDALLKRNQEGPTSPLLDSGLEWVDGLPDTFLLLIMQIINLKHASVSSTERNTRAIKIETALRGWKIWPSSAANSVMRIQRVSAQEIWRHFTILYLYQAIYKATSGDEAVQQSVKQIVKLATILRPGHNPDCLLYTPYFLAGTFAVSARDRQFFRDRLRRGPSIYTKTLVNALDELWEQSLIDKHVDWTSRTPPLVML